MEVLGYLLLGIVLIILPPYIADKYSHKPAVFIIPLGCIIGLIYSIYKYYYIPSQNIFIGLEWGFFVTKVIYFISQFLITTMFIIINRKESQRKKKKNNDK